MKAEPALLCGLLYPQGESQVSCCRHSIFVVWMNKRFPVLWYKLTCNKAVSTHEKYWLFLGPRRDRHNQVLTSNVVFTRNSSVSTLEHITAYGFCPRRSGFFVLFCFFNNSISVSRAGWTHSSYRHSFRPCLESHVSHGESLHNLPGTMKKLWY